MHTDPCARASLMVQERSHQEDSSGAPGIRVDPGGVRSVLSQPIQTSSSSRNPSLSSSRSVRSSTPSLS